MKLTRTYVDGLKPTTSDYSKWCSELPGFGVRCQPSGRKTYVLRYRLKNGKQRKATIADCRVMPPDDARKIARKMLADLSEGKDPGRTTSSEPTMQHLWERYHLEHITPNKKASTADKDVRIWNLHLKNDFGSKLVKEVRRADVISLHARMFKHKTNANRCVALLSNMFTKANEWEYLTDGSNPARRIKKFPERKRDRILSKDEIQRVKDGLDDVTVAFSFRRLVRLLLLTGCRVSEIALAETKWIDRTRGLLVLPDSKTGQRRIALSEQALAELEGVDGRWIIPSVNDPREPMRSAQHHWAVFRERVGLTDVRLHDLRHTVGSYAHQAGMNQREIAELLGHRQLATTERYIHGVGSTGSRNVEKVSEIMGL
jgi:integrase